jgi:hypothetical protein
LSPQPALDHLHRLPSNYPCWATPIIVLRSESLNLTRKLSKLPCGQMSGQSQERSSIRLAHAGEPCGADLFNVCVSTPVVNIYPDLEQLCSGMLPRWTNPTKVFPAYIVHIVTGPALREFSNEEMKVLFNSINKKQKLLIQKLKKSKVNLTATACYLIGA